jgi:hypothetical protein
MESASEATASVILLGPGREGSTNCSQCTSLFCKPLATTVEADAKIPQNWKSSPATFSCIADPTLFSLIDCLRICGFNLADAASTGESRETATENRDRIASIQTLPVRVNQTKGKTKLEKISSLIPSRQDRMRINAMPKSVFVILITCQNGSIVVSCCCMVTT